MRLPEGYTSVTWSGPATRALAGAVPRRAVSGPRKGGQGGTASHRRPRCDRQVPQLPVTCAARRGTGRCRHSPASAPVPAGGLMPDIWIAPGSPFYRDRSGEAHTDLQPHDHASPWLYHPPAPATVHGFRAERSQPDGDRARPGRGEHVGPPLHGALSNAGPDARTSQSAAVVVRRQPSRALARSAGCGRGQSRARLGPFRGTRASPGPAGTRHSSPRPRPTTGDSRLRPPT